MRLILVILLKISHKHHNEKVLSRNVHFSPDEYYVNRIDQEEIKISQKESCVIVRTKVLLLSEFYCHNRSCVVIV